MEHSETLDKGEEGMTDKDINSSKTLTKNEFRKLVKGKKIKVTLEATHQNYKKTINFSSPKIRLSSNGTSFGSMADGQSMSGPPIDMIIQRENIIELLLTTCETIKWTIEILEAKSEQDMEEPKKLLDHIEGIIDKDSEKKK